MTFNFMIFLYFINKPADGKGDGFYLTEVHNSNILLSRRTNWGSRFAENGRQVVWTSNIFKPSYEPFCMCNGSNTIVWC